MFTIKNVLFIRYLNFSGQLVFLPNNHHFMCLWIYVTLLEHWKCLLNQIEINIKMVKML
jgi:hypothetical protein